MTILIDNYTMRDIMPVAIPPGRYHRLIVFDNYSMQEIIAGLRYFIAKSQASPEVQQLAWEIIQGKPDPLVAIFDWVKTNVKYTPDPDKLELFISPVLQAEKFRAGEPLYGDCDDISLMMCSLLLPLGIPSRYMILDTRNAGWDHAVAEVDAGNGFFMLDPSSPLPPGWQETFYRRVQAWP